MTIVYNQEKICLGKAKVVQLMKAWGFKTEQWIEESDQSFKAYFFSEKGQLTNKWCKNLCARVRTNGSYEIFIQQRMPVEFTTGGGMGWEDRELYIFVHEEEDPETMVKQSVNSQDETPEPEQEDAFDE